MRALKLLLVVVSLLSGSHLIAGKRNVEDIQKEFDQLKYDQNDHQAFGNIPICDAVVWRQRQEHDAILSNELADSDDLSARYQYLKQYYFKNDGQLPGFAATTEGEKGKAYHPGFFDGDTPIRFIRVNKDGNQNKDHSDGTIGQLAMSDEHTDYVLSTTAFVPGITDPRYHLECWARVTNIHKMGVPAEAPKGIAMWEGKAGEKLAATIYESPALTIYALLEDKDTKELKIKRVALSNVRLGTTLATATVKDNTEPVKFASIYRPKNIPEFTAYNVEVPLTGVYFIGPIGAQVLVHH